MIERKRERHLYYGYRNDSFAVRVRVPCLLVDLQTALGRQESYERRHFGREMVYLVCVLAGIVFAAEQRVIVERFVLQHLDTFTAARVILGGLSNTVQLGHLILDTQIHAYVTHTYSKYTHRYILYSDLPLLPSRAMLHGWKQKKINDNSRMYDTVLTCYIRYPNTMTSRWYSQGCYICRTTDIHNNEIHRTHSLKHDKSLDGNKHRMK